MKRLQIEYRKPLPRSFKNHPDARGLLHEFDVTVRKHGKLHAKVMIFEKAKDFRSFWAKHLNGGNMRDTLGAVTKLVRWRVDPVTMKDVAMEVDPRYFCVIGLIAGNLYAEIITHEAVHAGYAYNERIMRNAWEEIGRGNAEELIAYPSGRVAQEIVNYLSHHKMLLGDNTK